MNITKVLLLFSNSEYLGYRNLNSLVLLTILIIISHIFFQHNQNFFVIFCHCNTPQDIFRVNISKLYSGSTNFLGKNYFRILLVSLLKQVIRLIMKLLIALNLFSSNSFFKSSYSFIFFIKAIVK